MSTSPSGPSRARRDRGWRRRAGRPDRSRNRPPPWPPRAGPPDCLGRGHRCVDANVDANVDDCVDDCVDDYANDYANDCAHSTPATADREPPGVQDGRPRFLQILHVDAAIPARSTRPARAGIR